MNDLKQKYLELNDYELLRIVYFESSEFTEEAIEAAKSVLAERGLSKPSEGLLQKVKEYKETPVSDFDVLGGGIIESTFKKGKFKEAVIKRDYYFIGKYLFWLALGLACFSIFAHGPPYTNPVKTVSGQDGILPWLIYNVIEMFLWIAIFGFVPVIFFIVYSLKLTRDQRREKGLDLFMPLYVFIIYGISFLSFLILFVIPRL